jgi:hypothetical protein
MPVIPGVVMVGVVLLVAWMLWNYAMEKVAVARRHSLLSSRRTYHDQKEWLQNHWAGSLNYEEDVRRVCNALAQRLRIDPTQLYESDRIDDELAISTAYYTAIDIDDPLNTFLDDDLRELSESNSSTILSGESLGTIVRKFQSSSLR